MYFQNQSEPYYNNYLDNIFIKKIEDGAYQVKIGDFGIARNVKHFRALADEGALQDLAATMAMTKIGTAFYMAPEINVSSYYDEKVDCYSFGQLALNCFKICGFVDKMTFIDGVTESEIYEPFLSVIKSALKQSPKLRPTSEEIFKKLNYKIPPSDFHF